MADLPSPLDRRCPGIFGEPCPTQTKLYKISSPVCERCRARYAFNGTVDAGVVRSHLRGLQRLGVGLRAIAATTGIPRKTLYDLRRGARKHIRAQSARRLLDVDVSCRADASVVPAARTWWQIEQLLADGYPARRLAKWLGYKGDAVQLGRVRITARNALRVEKLYRWLLSEAP